MGPMSEVDAHKIANLDRDALQIFTNHYDPCLPIVVLHTGTK